MPRLPRLRLLFALLGLLLVVPAAASAATTWSTLPPPWYGPSLLGYTDDAPAYRLHTMSSVAVVGDYAYTVEATLDRISVVDVRDPAQPVVAGSLQDSAHMDTPTWIVVQGGLAYVASKGASNADLAGSSLSVYDVSDPTDPTFVGSVTNDQRLYGAYGLQVIGSTAYIAAQGCVGGVGCVSSYPGGNALTILDVSDPTRPRITSSVSSLPQTQHLDSITVVGNRAYGTAFYTKRLTSFDVSDPAHPAILGSRVDARLTFANDVQVQGQRAFVVDQSTTGARLTVVDVSNPTTMPILGSVLDNTNLSYAYRLQINSRFAFVDAPRANALTVVDLANPASPQVVASISDPVKLANPIGLDLAGDTAYVAAYCPKVSGSCDPAQHGGLSAVDVSAFGDGAPDTAITSGPAPVSTSTAASFAFTSTRAGSSFTCALDGAAAAPCASPQAYSGLATGNHTLTITATSLAGVSDATPATYAWTISGATSPPDTTITAAPSGLVNRSSVSIGFTSDHPGATFECRLDGGSWTACSSPAPLTGLADGAHAFDVRATDAGGTDASPASAAWTVDTRAPSATYAGPGTVSAPIVLTFSEAVAQVTPANVSVGVTGSRAALPATQDCRTSANQPVSCGAGPVAKVTLTPTSTLLPGQRYTFTANPSGTPGLSDLAGNLLPSLTRSFRAQLAIDESNPAAAQTWATVSDPQALGGDYVTGALPGASATYAFSGASVTWYTVTGPGQGSADVYIDGGLRGTYDQRAATAGYGVQRTFTASGSGPHTIRIVVRSTGSVAVDGFDANGAQDPSPTITAKWQTVSVPAAAGGAYALSDQAGDRIGVTFRGTRVDLLTTNRPAGGMADVRVDGATVATIDTYAAKATYKVKRSFSVPDGIHTVTVTVLGTHQGAASGSLVGVDRFTIG